MKIIHNNLIPVKGFGLMNILGLVFSRIPEKLISARVKRHEGTHTYQQYELLTIGAIVALIFCNIYASWWYLLVLPVMPFAIYIFAFLVEFVCPPYHNAKECFEGKCFCDKIKAIPKWLRKVWLDAYRDNCFEREANANEDNPEYNSTRNWCAWVRYIIPKHERK